MIRYAVQFPDMLMRLPDNDFNGVRQEFIRIFKPVLYFPGLKYQLSSLFEFRLWIKKSKLINPDEYDFAFNVVELNKKADVLIYFNQYPLNLSKLKPPRRFSGLKIWHIFEYVFYASEVNKLLEENGADYLLGYADHGKYCQFFQKYYPKYINKVIQLPFGASKRFMLNASLHNRRKKVIALGSVNLVNEPNHDRNALKDYSSFYRNKKWTHEWRRMLLESQSELSDIMTSMLPIFPEMKNPNYDAVKLLSTYAMFANDEGLLCFPPARTYEGPACGSAMIASDFQGYSDLGFRDGINCILHQKNSVNDFRDKVLHYLENESKLAMIAKAGRELVYSNYTHEAVAKKLATQLAYIHSTGKKPDLCVPT
jgi:glycosyltransferase involved in cell wall biosynthesis